MFSPDPTTMPQSAPPAAQGTGTRRQRRKRNDDSVTQQPRRKRSKLSDDTFVPPSDAPSNGNGTSNANGHLARAPSRQVSSQLHTQDMPVREKPPAGKRGSKGDGSTVLTQNANYAVKQLPALPEQLRTSPESYRASTLRSTHQALALFRNQALIWDYTTLVTSPVAHQITLPHPAKASEPLPCGALVAAGTSNELGLVVITSSGKVTFWDNVDSAQSLSLLQRSRHGVEGNLSLFSGEQVVDLVDVEHAGFILVLNSGRFAQLTLRDAQGRPSVNTQFINKNGAGGGLFGGIRHMFAGVGANRDVAAVRARPSSNKGQMEVIVAYASGALQMWELSWTAQQSPRGELDVRPMILDALQTRASVPEQSGELDFKMLDMALTHVPRTGGNEVSIVGAREGLDVLVLIEYGVQSSLRFALAEFSLTGASATISRFIDLDTYAPSSTESNFSKVALLLPKPGHTAIVLAHGAAIIASLIDSERPFQDVVYLRQDQGRMLAGWACEDAISRNRASSCVAFLNGAGVIRLVCHEPVQDSKDAERTSLTAKSKLEQAVFYGGLPESSQVLSLDRKPNIEFARDEVELAARQITEEIITSSSSHMSARSSSMESQLQARGTYLIRLANLLEGNYSSPLSYQTRWLMMTSGDKLAAALAIWRVHESHLKQANKARPSLFAEVVDMIHERYKTGLDPTTGDVDPVRQWLTKDIGRINKVLAWIYPAIIELINEGKHGTRAILLYTSEADDISIAAIEAAFQYRQHNAGLFGLQDQIGDEGILDVGFANMRGPLWTATSNSIKALRDLSNLGADFGKDFLSRGETQSDADPLVIQKVIEDNARIVKIVCQIHKEYYQWCLAQDDEKTKAIGRSIQSQMPKIQHEQITHLSLIGMTEEGMKLAEKFKDMQSLVDLIIAEYQFLTSAVIDPSLTNDQREENQADLDKLDEYVDGYFRKFGDKFSRIYYASQIAQHRPSGIFDDAEVRLPRLTSYLQSNPQHANLCWINDVLGNRDFAHATNSLTVAAEQEDKAWSRKVELSLAKLASMAVGGPQVDMTNGTAKGLSDIDTELQILDLQEKVYKHVSPTAIRALDQDAEVDLVMEEFGHRATANKPAHHQILRTAFEHLLKHEKLDVELLIDLLTLMDDHQSDSQTPSDDISSQRFFVALQVLDVSGLATEQTEIHDVLHRLIWKRLYVSDPWDKINQTDQMSDEDIEAKLANTTLFTTAKLIADGDLSSRSPSFTTILPRFSIAADSSPLDPHLRARFPSSDLRDPIAQDNVRDDEKVESLIQRAKLEHWFKATSDLAARVAETDAEEKAEMDSKKRVLKEEQAKFGGDILMPNGVAEDVSFADGDAEVSMAEVDERGERVEASIEG